MDASIELLGVSAYRDFEASEAETLPSGLRVHCSLTVFLEADACQAFDDVTVSLQGAIRSQIGAETSVRKVGHTACR